jgi:hypothetical protein
LTNQWALILQIQDSSSTSPVVGEQGHSTAITTSLQDLIAWMVDILTADAAMSNDGKFEPHSSVKWDEALDQIKSDIENTVKKSFDIPSQPFKDPLTLRVETVDEIVAAIQKSLEKDFSDSPPFTIQRLAELIAEPNALYGRAFVYKYLLAMRQVLSVSSTIDQYPEDVIRQDLKNSSNHQDKAPDGGVYLTKISWVVDTGTPPPACLDDDQGEQGDQGQPPKHKQPRVDSYNAGTDAVKDSTSSAQTGCDAEEKNGMETAPAAPSVVADN